ncbi:MAG TPA: DUF3638 domain-containing protein, partial [Gammaproteobacteria bacterium]|nr:DUF3638 domain-containing protein [Gammaproteobacteria bacterium]
MQQHPNLNSPERGEELKPVILWLEEQNAILLKKILLQSTKENKNVERELLVIYFLKISVMEEGVQKIESIKQNLQLLLTGLLKSRVTESDNPILDAELIRAAQKIKTGIQTQFDLLPESEKKEMIKTILKDILVSTNIVPNMDNEKDYDIIFEAYPKVNINYRNKTTGESLAIDVDLSLGKVSTAKGRLQPMLPNIYNDWRFRALFGEARMPAIREDIEGKIFFSFKDDKGKSYRMIYDKDSTLHIQTKPPGEEQWFEWVPKEDVYTVSARYRDDDCHWWRETNVILPKLPKDYCSTVENGYLLKIERDASGLNQRCSNLWDLKGYQYLVDNKENANIYDVFRDFESSENIEVLGVPDKVSPLKVKLPRYNTLEWDVTINNESQLEYSWSKNNDFKLVVDHPQMIEGFPNVLYMKNKKTQETIAIVPKQEFYVEDLNKKDGEYYALKYDDANIVPKTICENHRKEKTLFWQPTSSLKPWKTTNTQKYYQFSVNNNELTAKTAEEYLQLAYIYLAKHDPDHAMWALKKCHKLGALQGTNEEVYLIMKIMKDIPNKNYNAQHYEKAFVKDPETTAVKLYAAWLLAEQKKNSIDQMRKKRSIQKWNKETSNYEYDNYVDNEIKTFYEESFVSDLNELYQDYRKVLGEIPEDMQLDYNQRLFLLLSNIKSPTAAMNNELIMLKLIAAKAQKKQFIKKQHQPHYKQNESDTKRLYEIEAEIEQLNALRKQAGIEENTEMASVFNREMVSGLQEQPFIDMKPVEEEKEQKDVLETEQPKEEKEQKEAQDFLKRQQGRAELEEKTGREKNEKLKTDIEAYKEIYTSEEQKKLLDAISHDVLNEKGEFKDSIVEKMLKDSVDEMLTLANAAISGIDSTLQTKFEVQGKIKSELQFGDLIWLYLQGDQKLFEQKTKITDPQQLKDLNSKIHQYLLDYTKYQHQVRMVKCLFTLKKCKDFECEDTIVKLGNEVGSERAYNPTMHPEMLVFEYLEDKLIRKDQVDVITRLLDKEKTEGVFKNQIIQLIMGFGKSKLLLPIMALKKSDGTNLSIIEIPAALFGPGFSDLSEKTERLFGKKGFPLIFNRDAKCESAILNTLYQGLLTAMRNRDYIATTPETMMSLQLKYLELTNLKNVTSEQHAQITHLENILKLIKERGDALIDECDTALDLKKELNYTLGIPEPVDEYILSNTLKIFKLLDQARIGVDPDSCTLKEVMLREKEILSDEKWDEVTKKLAEVLITSPDGPI